MTNGDKIRAMSDEDLADWLHNICTCIDEESDEPIISIYNLETYREEVVNDNYVDILEWLQKEVEE